MSAQPESSALPPVIVTDAACDLPAEDMQRYGIKALSLKILFGDEVYRSGVDMTQEQFYARLARGDVHPTTSQPTVPEFVELFKEAAQEGRPILSINLSEGLSGTVNAARAAARELPELDITVHDCGTLTSAEGIQVLTAARATQAGWTVEQILPVLHETYRTGGMYFSVEDLTYLHRGGRIGSVRYHIGQALRIKPVVTVAKEGPEKGTYIQAGRVRSLAKAVDAFVELMVQQLGAGSKLRAVALYGDDPTIATQLNARLAETFDCVYLHMVPTAPVLGVHVGPGALGIGFAKGDWPV